MKRCVAITDGDRISFAIQKGEDGYEEFAKVLSSVAESGCWKLWYGDIVNADGVEQSGLVIVPANAPIPNGEIQNEWIEY